LVYLINSGNDLEKFNLLFIVLVILPFKRNTSQDANRHVTNILHGFYDKNDKALAHNLIGSRNKEMNDLELSCKAFIQDYMERVVDQKLTSH
jgi:hypothetical protein